MNISTEQAAAALRDVESARAQSQVLKGYERGAPYFFLWGIVWIIGYTATGLSPRYAIVWVPLAVIGAAMSIFIGQRQERVLPVEHRKSGIRVGLTWVISTAFYGATLSILHPTTVNQFGAFPALLMSAIYASIGVWLLPRWLWLGAGIFAATLVGYFYLAPWFSFWMAAVGGGGLVLSGFWMQKA